MYIRNTMRPHKEQSTVRPSLLGCEIAASSRAPEKLSKFCFLKIIIPIYTIMTQKAEIFVNLGDEEYKEAVELHKDYPFDRVDGTDMLEHDKEDVEYMIALGADKDTVVEYVKDRLSLYCRWCPPSFQPPHGKPFGFTVNMETGSIKIPPEIEQSVKKHTSRSAIDQILEGKPLNCPK
jgi:hypothetical protein